MRRFEVLVDPPQGADIEVDLRRELQTLEVSSVTRKGDRVTVAVSDEGPPLSQVLTTHTIAGLPVDEVRHHAAVLPRWLTMFYGGPPVYIIHADSHDDLGRPNIIFGADGGLRDRWTGAIVDPRQPATVRAAIDSAAIEIGSYLTAALHWLPLAGVAFVFPAESRGNIAGVRAPTAVGVAWSVGDTLHREVRRLHCRPTASGCGVPAVRCDGRRGLTRLREVIPPDARVVLDIDADFFDDSDENGRAFTVFDRGEVAAFMKCVQAAVPPNQLSLVSVSLSPGFCPRESAEQIAADIRAALTSVV